MLGYDELLTNFTDASLEMSGEFGQKMQETSKYDPRYKCPTNDKQAQG